MISTISMFCCTMLKFEVKFNDMFRGLFLIFTTGGKKQKTAVQIDPKTVYHICAYVHTSEPLA